MSSQRRGRPRKLTNDDVERAVFMYKTQSLAQVARHFKVTGPTIAKYIDEWHRTHRED